MDGSQLAIQEPKGVAGQRSYFLWVSRILKEFKLKIKKKKGRKKKKEKKKKIHGLIFLRSKEKDSLNFLLRVGPHGRVFLIKTGVESRSFSES